MRPLLLVFLPLLVAYLTAIRWCVERWNAPTEYFAHCWLVPPLAALVVWHRRRDWRTRARRTDPRGLWLLVPGLLLHLVGAALMIDSWSAASLVLTVPGAAWFALGRERLRGLWPVIGLLLFCVPLPIFVEGRLAFVLKEIAVGAGTWLANLLGAGVVRAGDRLLPTGLDGSLYVADACSGLRSLLAMVTLGYCLAFFTGPPHALRRTLLLAITAPLAIAANIVRIAALCLLARWFGVPFAEGTGHTLANVAEWLALLLLLVASDGVLGRRFATAGRQPEAPPTVPPTAPADAAGGLRGAAIALWLVCVPLLVLSLYRPFGERRDRAERLPEVVGAYRLEPQSPAQQQAFAQALPRWRELLGTEDFVYRQYRDDRQHLINLVALFHDSNWKSVHPPRICIEGSNMVIERDELLPADWLGDGVVLSRIVARRRDSGWRYVTLSLFGTDTWCSGDYWQFALHHLPRALLRRTETGFLLRVESPIYRGEQVADATKRCRAFLQELLPAAREVLR